MQTTAAGKGTISVKWKFGAQVIDEPTKQVDYDGPASTEFHLQNSGGFPPGDYSVDVFIDGVQVGTPRVQGRAVLLLGLEGLRS